MCIRYLVTPIECRLFIFPVVNNDARAFFSFAFCMFVDEPTDAWYGYSVKILFMIVIVIGFVAPKEGTE